jgi:CHAD domain-containing protein
MTEAAEYQPQQDANASAAPPVLAHLRSVAKDMREKLDACRKHGNAPKVEAVHHLRTGTRRVEATLETIAREAGARGLGAEVEQARQRWLKQLKKVRRAAGVVRDLDVHRDLLAKNFLSAADKAPDGASKGLASAAANDAANPVKTTPLIEQARALDRWLDTRRTDAATALCGTLDGHAARLLQAEQEFMIAIQRRRSFARRAQRAAVRLALEDYLRLMDQMPLLDRENLHDFRKGAKKARYVAESEEHDPAAEAMAKTVKRTQDAIGDWHDWVMVSEEAQQALGNNGAELQRDLEARAQRAYDRALRITASTGRRITGEWRALQPRRVQSARGSVKRSRLSS